MSWPPSGPSPPGSNPPPAPGQPLLPSTTAQFDAASQEPSLPAGSTTQCDSCGGFFASENVVPIAGRNICADCKPAAVQRLLQNGAIGLPVASPPKQPRVWPALVVTPLAILASVGAAAVVLIIALFASGTFQPGQMPDVQGAIMRLIEEPWGSTVIVLPGQLTMLGTVIVATLLARRRLAPRLGYTRSLLPWRAFPLLLAGTLFTGGLGGMIAEWLYPEPSQGIKFVQDMMLKPTGAGLVAVAIMVCILPPVCEEALFRGYLQRRLLQRWHPAAAIAVSTAFFVLAHFDPEHVLGVIPLGVWLGVVAWRCDSLLPSMLCHFAQNSLALVATRLAGDSYKETSPAQLIVVGVAGVLSVWAIIIMRRHPVPGRVVAPA